MKSLYDELWDHWRPYEDMSSFGVSRKVLDKVDDNLWVIVHEKIGGSLVEDMISASIRKRLTFRTKPAKVGNMKYKNRTLRVGALIKDGDERLEDGKWVPVPVIAIGECVQENERGMYRRVYAISDVADCYPERKCPDCREDIPEGTQEGEACLNCEHVFCFERKNSNA